MPRNGSLAARGAPWAVFVDFDGTVTDVDTFDVLVKHFAGEEAWHATERGLDDGTVSLRDVLQRQASYVRAPFDDVAALLARSVRVDPAFAPFVADCHAREIPVTVLSSGIRPIICGRLAELGLADLDVVANDVDPNPAGWRITFRDPAPNGTDKAAQVAQAQAIGRRAIFIGDGRSDYDAAVRADSRFARRGLQLERYLQDRGVPFEPFSSFVDVRERLDAIARS